MKTSPPRLTALLILLACSSPGPAARAQFIELRSPYEEINGNFGIAVRGAGDVNNDGFDDVIVGASLEDAMVDSTSSGRAYVFDGTNGELIHELNSPAVQFNGRFGTDVCGIGDLNGDGFAEIAVAAVNESSAPSPLGAGRVYVFDGQTGSLIRTLKSPLEDEAGQFGVWIDNAGDVNKNGYSDLVIGALAEDLPATGGAGRAYLFDGGTGSLIHTFESPDPLINGSFGSSVAAAGDVDDDTYPDVIVGAFWEESEFGPANEGRAYVFSGLTGSLIHDLVSPNPGNDGNFGAIVSSAGDLNADGFDDVAVGARGEAAPFSAAGRTYVFDGQSGDLMFTLESPDPETSGLFGSVAWVGDANDDGIDDLAVGAAGEDGRAGRVYVVSGQSRDTLATIVSPNPEPNGFFGARVASAGDTNADGTLDLVVYAAREAPDGSPDGAGRAYIVRLPFERAGGTAAQSPPISDRLWLDQNYPNPFRESTLINYRIGRPGHATIAVFNLVGQRVATFTDRYHAIGDYRVRWDRRRSAGGALPSGIYLYSLRTTGLEVVRMMVAL